MTGWVEEFCARELGAAPVELLLSAELVSDVRAVRLDDGRHVVLKARAAEKARRAASCVEAQRVVAEQGFPCPRPLTGVVVVADRAVHAEEWRPGGAMLRDDGLEAAAASARLLADLMRRLEGAGVDPPLPNPDWVRWDHDGPGLFAPNPRHDALAAGAALPAVIDGTALRVRERMRRSSLPPVLGHADWEAQNLRWQDGRPHAVHDWDSLAWLPEAALVGAAAGAFASQETPTLAPLESSAAFLEAYGQAFSDEELEIAWAASLWPALHNARGELLYAQPPVALTALREQGVHRLRLGGA